MASHPIQYQAPWFRALARATDLDVYFCHRQDAHGQAAAGYGTEFEWDGALLEGYRHHWLHNRSRTPNVFSFGGCDTPGVAEALAEGRFDACIVCGWYLKSYVQAIAACRTRGIKVLVRGDSHLGTARSRIRSAVKWLPYRALLNRADGHLYVGTANKAYLRHYGVDEEKLFFVPHGVDNHFFADGAAQAMADGTAAAIRRGFGIPEEASAALFVGRLLPGKRLDDLIVALAHRQARGGVAIHAIVVGSGPEEQRLRALATDAGVHVHFAGFCNQGRLPAMYAASDFLVLPSESETWGLVVNEAMACGLPVVVSSAVGCGADLVREGRTGRTFPPGDTAALADALAATAHDLRVDKASVRQAVTSLIADYDCSRAVEATLRAVDAVTDRTRAGQPC